MHREGGFYGVRETERGRGTVAVKHLLRVI